MPKEIATNTGFSEAMLIFDILILRQYLKDNYIYAFFKNIFLLMKGQKPRLIGRKKHI